MKIIDARRQLCPRPLIMAKKALKELAFNDVFALLIDNETSKTNVERFLTENKISFHTSKKNEWFELIISKDQNTLLNEQVNEFCHLTNDPASLKTTLTGDMIIMNKNSIGHGPEDLAVKLVKGFFMTIMEVPQKPLAMAFYNSGILLCLEDSCVLEELQSIEKAGCKILVCGTCIDHYDVKSKVKVGVVSNMLDILGMMGQASKVFSP